MKRLAVALTMAATTPVFADGLTDAQIRKIDRRIDRGLPRELPVHNYQRLTKSLTADEIIPYLVVGAGGYHNLHHIMTVNGEKMIPPVVFQDKAGEQVTLERYCDDRSGFCRTRQDRGPLLHRAAAPRAVEQGEPGHGLFRVRLEEPPVLAKHAQVRGLLVTRPVPRRTVPFASAGSARFVFTVSVMLLHGNWIVSLSGSGAHPGEGKSITAGAIYPSPRLAKY